MSTEDYQNAVLYSGMLLATLLKNGIKCAPLVPDAYNIIRIPRDFEIEFIAITVTRLPREEEVPSQIDPDFRT